jgi:hypothetical protein
MATKTISRNAFDDLCHRLKHLEVLVRRLQNRRSVVIPVYDSDRLPAHLPTNLLYFTLDNKKFNISVDGLVHQANTVRIDI